MIKYNPVQITGPKAGNNSVIPAGNLLRIRTANKCIEDAKNLPEPRMLFSEFWHEGELCILYADTNLGKSILAVQIADAISKGIAVSGFKHNAARQPVLYFDFEMSDKQFEKRYSCNFTHHYQFDDNFYRIEINPYCTDFVDFETALQQELAQSIQKYDAKVLIIDNLTYLKTEATDTAKEALPLMKTLKELTVKHGLSVLALAHTPKRNLSNPLTHNDLAGSKHFSNFADSLFAIGESSQDKSLRYLKQIKARATEHVYDAANIIVCEVTKNYNFLGFQVVGYDAEATHLRTQDKKQLSEADNAIIDMKRTDPQISNYEIAKALNINQMRVKRVLDRNVAALISELPLPDIITNSPNGFF